MFLPMQASLLDAEFEKMSPVLSETLNSINSQITEGFSTTQIALAVVGMPLLYQLLKIASGYADMHRDGIKTRRDRDTREHEAKLERENAILKARLSRGEIPAESAPAPLPPAQ